MGKKLEKAGRWFGRETAKLQTEVVAGFRNGVEDAKQGYLDENARLEKARKVATALGVQTQGKTLQQLLAEIRSML